MDDHQYTASTVLLVGPPADDQAMYAIYLRGQGLDPVVIDDLDEAFRQAAQMDLIVTDIRLRAAADGLAFVKRLRQHEPTRSTPIIVLTACAFDEDRDRAMAAGCNTFLSKPCPPETLLVEVRKLMGESRQLRVEALQHMVRSQVAIRTAASLATESTALRPTTPDEPPAQDPTATDPRE